MELLELIRDLFEEHNNNYETITDDEIIGRYELVTEHIYPDDFVEIAETLKKDQS